MPAKSKKSSDKNTKQEKKIKEKIIEDKTFGLKNKNKSAAVQKYIKGVQQQVKGVPKGGEQAFIASQIQSKEEKKKAQADQLLLASLFKAVVEMPKDDADPKSTVCPFYKSGFCQKGAKCKFSHDLSSEPIKQEKPDMYTDKRAVVSEITCQFFLEAVESDKFGWFWKCPNGDECIYRHALPEGYVFKTEENKNEVEEEEKMTLEQEVDIERGKLPSGLKPVTFDEFMAWVNENTLRREEEKNESRKGLKGLSGKALFEKDSGLFQDDEDAYDDYQREENLEEELPTDQRMMFDVEEHKDEDLKDENQYLKDEKPNPEEYKDEEDKNQENKHEDYENFDQKDEKLNNQEHKDETHRLEERKDEEHKDEEHKGKEHKNEEHKDEEHKNKEHKDEEHKDKEHKNEEHKDEEHKNEEHKNEEHKNEEHKNEEGKHELHGNLEHEDKRNKLEEDEEHKQEGNKDQ
jgi:DRG Family Regulatory Proteins, Tma46/Zinc finger C-x8-C-x5-C-x3-H type (and similar)